VSRCVWPARRATARVGCLLGAYRESHSRTKIQQTLPNWGIPPKVQAHTDWHFLLTRTTAENQDAFVTRRRPTVSHRRRARLSGVTLWSGRTGVQEPARRLSVAEDGAKGTSFARVQAARQWLQCYPVHCSGGAMLPGEGQGRYAKLRAHLLAGAHCSCVNLQSFTGQTGIYTICAIPPGQAGGRFCHWGPHRCTQGVMPMVGFLCHTSRRRLGTRARQQPDSVANPRQLASQ